MVASIVRRGKARLTGIVSRGVPLPDIDQGSSDEGLKGMPHLGQRAISNPRSEYPH